MRDATILTAKGLIALLFAGLLFVQAWFIPMVSNAMADDAPEFEPLRVPGIVLPILLILCVEVVLVCVWRLLSMVRTDSIFRESAFAWVSVVLGSIVAATALVTIGVAVIWWGGAGSPMVAIAGVMTVLVGIGLSLLVAVMQGLLRKASRLERELSEVV
ncbi:DUF2975 domain-containing protein [Microbacterium suaedae]|uniref:DUF2975 domain-containing protein n=1 Tax=Microbacterium suaedae TaxID=2067813 RepID=UPI0013A64685|nr:DUF2975 domain-containing protein [Microbacterium suaedae]